LPNLLRSTHPVVCNGVQNGPGATAFTRIPCLATCFASDFVKAMAHAFVCT